MRKRMISLLMALVMVIGFVSLTSIEANAKIWGTGKCDLSSIDAGDILWQGAIIEKDLPGEVAIRKSEAIDGSAYSDLFSLKRNHKWTADGYYYVKSISDDTMYIYPLAKDGCVDYYPNGGDQQQGSFTAVFREISFAAQGYGEPGSPLRFPQYTRTGYTLSGWNTEADGTGNVVTYDTVVPKEGNLAMYAQWTANAYTVSFNANGGSVEPASKTVTYDSTYGTLPTPTKDGYTFAGWFTETENGTEVTSDTTVTITSEQTLYAHWEAHTHCVCGSGACTAHGTAIQCEPWEAADSLPTQPGSYYLTQNVVLSQMWDVPKGDVVNLCLNGKTISSTAGNFRAISVGYSGAATLNLTDCSQEQSGKISGFSVDDGSSGGAAYVNPSGTFNMYGGSFVENTSGSHGGALYVNEGTFAMHGGSFVGNQAGKSGGGVYIMGSAVIENSTFTGNSGEEGSGGAICCEGNITVKNCTISGNSAYSGGGIGLNNGNLRLENTTVTSNKSSKDGAVAPSRSTVTLAGNTEIYGNTITGTEQDCNLFLYYNNQDNFVVEDLNNQHKIGVTCNRTWNNVTSTFTVKRSDASANLDRFKSDIPEQIVFVDDYNNLVVGYPFVVCAPTDHGSIAVDPIRPSYGNPVTITVQPDPGYEVTEITARYVNGNAAIRKVNNTTYQFTYYGDQYTVTAVLGSDGTHAIATPAAPANGTVTLDAENGRGKEGTIVKITADPDEGYVVDDITVTKADGSGTVTVEKGEAENTHIFTMPACDIDISVTFRQALEYDIWVGGERVTDNNLVIDSNDNAGITTGSATYDPKTGILTLDGFTYTGAGYNYDKSVNYAAIYTEEMLKIVLQDTNSITCTVEQYHRGTGIHSDRLIEISGDTDDTLTVTAGIYTDHVVIKNAAVDVSGGIAAPDGSIKITNANVNISGEIHADLGEISGSTVTATAKGELGGYGIRCSTLKINDSTVTATSADCTVSESTSGIRGEEIYITNSTVTANGGSASGNRAESYGIVGDATITNSTVTANGGSATGNEAKSYGIMGADTRITNSTVAFSGSTKAIWYDYDSVSLTSPHTIYAGDIGGELGLFDISSACAKQRVTMVPTVFDVEDDTDQNAKGSVEFSVEGATAGTEVKIKVAAETGYQLTSLIVMGNKNIAVTLLSGDPEGYTHKFTMPDSAVSVKAEFILEQYSITYDLAGGTATGNPENYNILTEFTLTNPIKKGYTFAGWTGTDLTEPTMEVTVNTGSTGAKNFTANWTLNAATVTVGTGCSKTYDGQAYTIEATAAHEITGAALSFQWYKDGKADGNLVSGEAAASYDVINVPESGIYYCKVTATVNADTSDVWSEPVTVTISKAPSFGAVTAVEDLAYKGTPQALVTAGTATGGDYAYKLDDEVQWQNTIPTVTDAGSYTVYWKVVGDSNHTDYAGTEGISVTVAQKPLTVTAQDKSKVYGATEPNLTWTAEGLVGQDTLTGALTRAAGEDVGAYNITLGTLGNKNYSITYQGATLTISKAPLTVTAKDKTITYGDAPANDGVTYSGLVNGDNAAKLEAESTLAYTYSYAQYGDVGEYTITPKNLTSGNYEINFVSGKLTVVQKEVEEPTVSKPYTYTGEEQTVELDGFDDAYMQVFGNKGIDATYYNAVVTLGGNYTWADDADGLIEWCIEKAALTDISVAQDGVLYYTGEPQVPQVITEGSTVDGEPVNFRYRINYHQNYSPLSILSQKFIEVKDYTVYYKASAENHNDVEGSFTVTVAKAAVPGSSAFSYTEPTLTYNGLEQNISVTTDLDGVAAEDITVIYSATPRNAGDYTFTIKVAESQNYLADTVTDPAWAFTIAKADPQITWETTEFTYDKQSHGEAAVTLVNGETYTGKITYTFGDGEEGLPVNAGTYSVTASVAEQDNYNAATATKSVTVKPKAVTPTVTLSEESFTWDGTAKKPAVVVKDGDDVLSSGEYSVTYADNTVVGVGNVCVTDKENGNYTVAKTDKKFLILPDVSGLKTPDTVTSAKEDTDAIAAVENDVAKIKNHAQYEDASLAAKADLARVETLCLSLRAAISNAAEKSEQITQSTENLPEQPTTDNLAGIQNALDTYESIKDNLTEAEKEALADEIRELEKQKAAIEKTNADLKSVDDGTQDLVEDKPNLEYADKATIKALEDKIADIEKNNSYLSERDKQNLQTQKTTLATLKAEFVEADKVTEKVNALNTKAAPDDGNAVAAYEDAKKAYAELSDADKAKVDPAALKHLADMKAALTAYKIIKGDSTKHQLGSSQGLTIVSNGYYPHFRYVKVNGREISSSNYTSASGSTIVTLKPEYVNRLMTGKYTITIGFGDEDYIGEATANVQLYTDSGLPFTGDTIAMWIAMMAVSAGALIVVLVFAKKKSSSKK